MIWKISMLVAGFGGLFAIIQAAANLYDIAVKKKSAKTRMIPEWEFALVALLLVQVPAATAWQCVTAPVPDGDYTVKIGVLPKGYDMMPLHLDADISVYRDIEYEDYEGSYAGIDTTRTRVYATDYVYLNSVSSPDGEFLFAYGDTIRTGEPDTIYVDEFGDLEIEVQPVTKESLGFSPVDIWRMRSASTKAWDIAPVVSCLLILAQHIYYLKNKEE